MPIYWQEYCPGDSKRNRMWPFVVPDELVEDMRAPPWGWGVVFSETRILALQLGGVS